MFGSLSRENLCCGYAAHKTKFSLNYLKYNYYKKVHKKELLCCTEKKAKTLSSLFYSIRSFKEKKSSFCENIYRLFSVVNHS